MEDEMSEQEHWLAIIDSKSKFLRLNLKELLQYKFLIFLFIRRDFVAQFKQTILGPLWFIIQPLFTTGIYSVIFGGLAGIPTDGVPLPVFYMSGTTLWGYFSSCLNGTSSVLVSNAGIFGKVYFPRLAVPISVVVTRLYTFIIQIVLFLVVYGFFLLNNANLRPNLWLFCLPLLIAHTALLGMAVGLWTSALSVKYRDLIQLVGFGVSLWMWATPIVYPLSLVPDRLRFLIYLNPVAPILEIFRHGFTGVGDVPIAPYLTSCAVTAILLYLGLLFFRRAEQTFIDVV